MTDKARELLERALLVIDDLSGPNLRSVDSAIKDISEYLADTHPSERLDLIGELHPNGLVDFVNDEMPIHHVFPVKLYAKGEALINEIAKCNSDILLGKDHPAPRPEFVKLSEEEMRDVYAAWMLDVRTDMYAFARAIEDALEKKNIINKSDPDSVDLQSRCRGDKP